MIEPAHDTRLPALRARLVQPSQFLVIAMSALLLPIPPAFAQTSQSVYFLTGLASWIVPIVLIGLLIRLVRRWRRKGSATATGARRQLGWFNLELIIGVVIVVMLLAGVQSATLFGQTCYAVGGVTTSSGCINPALYFGAWVVAIGCVGYGLYKGVLRHG